MIYFIKAKGLDLIKIGQTQNINARIKQLQLASPVELKYIKKIDVKDNNIESLLHAAFRSKLKRGEWFTFDKELKKFVTQLQEDIKYTFEQVQNIIKNMGIQFSVLSKHKKPLNNKIQEWQEKNGISNAELARRLNVHFSFISHLNKGRRKFSPELALKIEEITNGEVDKLELLYPE